MNKNINRILFSITLFFIGILLVNAKTFSTDTDIDGNSYVIGTHLFTNKITLDVRKIMLAAKTIDSDDISDMIIYYKDPWGEWQNASNGNEIEIDNTKTITHKDLVPLDDTLIVQFDSNGGMGSMNTQYIYKSQSEVLNANKFTKENYFFKKWNTKRDGSGTSYYDYQKITNNYEDDTTITLYAQWELLETEIIFNNLSDDSVASVDKPDTIEMFNMESNDGKYAWFAIEDGRWFVNQQINNSTLNPVSNAYVYNFTNDKWNFAITDEDKQKYYVGDLDTLVLHNYRVLSSEEAALVNYEFDIYRDGTDNYTFLSTEDINKIITIRNIS